MAKEATMTFKFVLSLILLGITANAENILLNITNGAILGETGYTSRYKRTMYMFKGIPYAEKPERFQWAVEKQPWDSVINCTYDKPQCVQGLNEVSGSEDCLTLSVYTPDLNGSYPVLFWIHGGFFTQGNGSYKNAASDFFMEEGVVFVQIQYRLGALGFMSTGDLNCPGNWGLKDQVVALRWVRKNIRYFGGDPNKVTIGGQSAGAVAASLHLLSPKSEGLFHGMILNSGSALNLWALDRRAKQNAFSAGLLLKIVTVSSKELVEEMRKKDVKELQKSYYTVSLASTIPQPTAGIFSGYVSEPEHPDAFFSGYSEERLSNGDFTKVPLMLGVNSMESMSFGNVTGLIRAYLVSYDVVPSKIAPYDLTSSLFDKWTAGLKIKDYFFNGGISTASDFKVHDYISSDQFVRPIWRFGLDASQYIDQVYFYCFAYQGPLSGASTREVDGVGHSEELKYLFSFPNTSSIATDYIVRNRMVKLWSNFCKHRNPTPTDDSVLLNKRWLPMRENNVTGDYNYFQIDSSLEPLTNFRKDTIDFYDGIYSKYGEGIYDTY